MMMLLLLPCSAADDARKPVILFVVGGVGTAGGPECGGAPGRHIECKSEHRASIHNTQTFQGNHGWAEKAMLLRADGFELREVEEGPWDQPAPVRFRDMDLSDVAVIVMGSNNVTEYPSEDIDALELFVRQGGGVLFLSDANFGPDWTAAMKSDQPFLDRFGLIMNQDHGTQTLKRDADFTESGRAHPVLRGVDRFDGEGVSPITIRETLPEGVRLQVLARVNRVKTPEGALRAGTERDGALIVGTAGEGRMAFFFDRNSFFNRNGAGTHLHRFENATLAGNLYRWLAGKPDPGTP
jgi:hypothetical protein